MAAPAPQDLFQLASLPGWTPLAAAPTLLPPTRPSTGAAPLPASDASWVRTAEDAMAYFEHWGEGAPTHQIFYCVHGAPGDDGADAAAAEFFLRVVPPAATANLAGYYILSRRQLVRVELRRSQQPVRATAEAVPLAEWAAHKQAYLSLRELTFFGSFSLAKCFHRWRGNYVARRFRRRRRQAGEAAAAARPAFQAALLEAAAQLQALRGVRAAWVQPGGRPCTAAEWAEQQEGQRERRAQPEVEAAVAALVRAAERVCGQVKAAAAHMQASVKPCELADRTGVDLYAGSSAARHRSMQRVRQEKEARAAAYTQALADRDHLPRFLRLLDLRLAAALADLAVGTVAAAAGALRAAAPGLSLEAAGAAGGMQLDDGCGAAPAVSRVQPGAEPAAAASGSPVFTCSLVVDEAGAGIELSPSEAEWLAAQREEVVDATLRLVGGVQALHTLPPFQRYHQHAAGGPAGEGAQPPQWEHRQGPDSLAQQDAAFGAASAELATLLRLSFQRGRASAQQYRQYLPIHQFGLTWDFEAWAQRQSERIDLAETEATLSQLRAWRRQLDGMPLAQPAGLLLLDAAPLHVSLLHVVDGAGDAITGLLLQLGGGQCCALFGELSRWREVAAARPPDLEAGFLPWAAELACMRQAAAVQLAAATAAAAALDLVACHTGRLPTAEAVKADNLREVAAALPAALDAAAGWQEEQRGVHAAAAVEQARQLAEEAAQLESEIKARLRAGLALRLRLQRVASGLPWPVNAALQRPLPVPPTPVEQAAAYGDAGAAAADALAGLDLQQAALRSLAAQAEAAAALAAELGVQAPGGGAEVAAAEAAMQRCLALWRLVGEAEALQGVLAMPESTTEELMGSEARAPPPTPDEAALRLAGLQLRLGGAGPGGADAVWLRASDALAAARRLLPGGQE